MERNPVVEENEPNTVCIDRRGESENGETLKRCLVGLGKIFIMFRLVQWRNEFWTTNMMSNMNSHFKF